MRSNISFPAPPEGGYFSGEHQARRVRRVQARAIAIANGNPVNAYEASIPERDTYLAQCLNVAASEVALPTTPPPAATSKPKASKRVAIPQDNVAASVAVTADGSDATCEWKTSGKLCGLPIQDGFRFCAKHVTVCEKRGYPQRALAKTTKAAKEGASAPSPTAPVLTSVAVAPDPVVEMTAAPSGTIRVRIELEDCSYDATGAVIEGTYSEHLSTDLGDSWFDVDNGCVEDDENLCAALRLVVGTMREQEL